MDVDVEKEVDVDSDELERKVRELKENLGWVF